MSNWAIRLSKVNQIPCDGRKLELLRLVRGMTMVELARRAGITRQELWALETRRTSKIQRKSFAALAGAFGMTHPEFLKAIMPDGDDSYIVCPGCKAIIHRYNTYRKPAVQKQNSTEQPQKQKSSEIASPEQNCSEGQNTI